MKKKLPNFLILTAGQGNRLKPITNSIPKGMVPLHENPLIHWQLQNVNSLGFTSKALVTGHGAESIQNGDYKVFFNKEYATTNMVRSLLCAQDFFEDDLIVSYGDIVYNKDLIEMLLASDDDLSIVIDREWRPYWECRSENPLADAETLRLDKDGYIVEVGQRPKTLGEIQGQYIGLFRIKGKALEKMLSLVSKADPDKGGIIHPHKGLNSVFMTDLLNALIEKGVPAKAIITDGGWLEIDSIMDLAIAQRASKVEGGQLVIDRKWIYGTLPKQRTQNGAVIWITGLPGSGKTTLANILKSKFEDIGKLPILIDGDQIREAFGNDLGYSIKDRKINANRISKFCKLLADQGNLVLCSTVSLFHDVQDWNKSNIKNYFEVFLKVEIETAKKRHPKNLYEEAHKGNINDMVGLQQVPEFPRNPNLVLDSGGSISPVNLSEVVLSEYSKYF